MMRPSASLVMMQSSEEAMTAAFSDSDARRPSSARFLSVMSAVEPATRSTRLVAASRTAAPVVETQRRWPSVDRTRYSSETVIDRLFRNAR